MAMLALCGCPLLLVGGGAVAGGGAAVYYRGRLRETLNAPLPQARKAAAGALEDLELPVLVDKADSLTGRLESRYADGKDVRIDLKAVVDTHTEVTIRVGTFGDKERAVAILHKMKNRLGL